MARASNNNSNQGAPDASEEYARRQGNSNPLDEVAKKMTEQNRQAADAAKETKAELAEMQKLMSESLRDFSDNSKKMDAFQRKASIKNMKEMSDILGKIPDELFKDKTEYMALLDQTLGEMDKTSGILDRIAGDFKKGLGSLIKTPSLYAAFLDNTNPFVKTMLGAALGLGGYVNGLRKDQKINAKATAAELDKLATTVQEGADKATKEGEGDPSTKKASEGQDEAKKPRYGHKQLEVLGKIEEHTQDTAGIMEYVADLQSKQNETLKSIADMLAKCGCHEDSTKNDGAHDKDAEKTQEKYTKVLSDDFETYSLLTIDAIEESTKVLNSINDHLARLAEFSQQQIEQAAMLRQDMEKDRLQNIQRDRESRIKTTTGFGPGKDAANDDSKGGGGLTNFLGNLIGNLFGGKFLGKIFGMLKGGLPKLLMGGAGAAGSGLMAGLMGGADVMGKGVKMLRGMKTLPFIGTILSVGFALNDFYDGWQNAGKILGKETKDLTTSDKVYSGIAAAVGGFVGNLVDTVAGWFGFDTGLEKMITENGAKMLVSMHESIASFFDNFVENMGKFFTGVGEWMGDFFPKMIDGLVEAIKSAATAMVTALPMGDKIASMLGLGGDSTGDPKLKEQTGTGAQSPDVIKNQEGQIADNDRKLADQRAANQVSMNQVDASSSNVTNNSYSGPLTTRNNDSSVKSRFGMSFPTA